MRFKSYLVLLLAYHSLTLRAQIQIGIDIDGKASGDASHVVSMPDVHTVAIGGTGNGGNGPNSGHVRVYRWNGVVWAQKGDDIDGESSYDVSGSSVSMPDSSTVAIGAPYYSGNDSNSGQVRIYRWNGSDWTQKGLSIFGEFANDYSGSAISMPDSNTIAIGAWGNDGNGLNSGHVRVFSWNGSAWSQKGADIDGENIDDRSGFSISMPDSNTIAIGAWGNDGNGLTSGHVRLYKWNGIGWAQKGLDIDGESAGDASGYSVSMPDSSTVGIGAYGHDKLGQTNVGHVRVYSWNGNAWSQKGDDIYGESSYDMSGWSVSMPDVNTIAIGAPSNSGNGSYSGHVRVYKWNGIAWTQKGLDIDGESAGDISGERISMPDANTVAIGAWANSGGGSLSGHVRVYQICNDSLVVQPLDFTAFSTVGWANYTCKSSDSSASYQWLMNDGGGWTTLSNSGDYLGVTTDSLVVLNINTSMDSFSFRCLVDGCSLDSSDIALLTVANGIGVIDSEDSELNVYPNPTDGIIRLNFDSNGFYIMCSLDGRTLEQGKVKGIYDLSSYPSGTYIIYLVSEKENSTVKVFLY